MTAQRDLEGKIKAYLGKGWQVDFEGDSPSSYDWGSLYGPTGNVFSFRKMALNECTICCEEDERNTFTDDDGDEAHLCTHSEQDLAEEQTARELYALIRQYSDAHGTALFKQPKR